MDEPATDISFVMRRALFWLAWLLLSASLLIPAPSGTPGPDTIGGSALYVYGLAVGWSQAAPGSPGHPGFLRVAMLALALYSNVVFIIMPYMLRVRSVAITTRIFLVAALAIDAGTGMLVPEFTRLPAYWIWVAAIAAIVIAFVVFSGDPSPAFARRSKDKAPVDRGEFSPFVWVLLGATLFWVAVSALNHAFPEKDSAAAGEPLTTYVNDRAQLLKLDEASRLSFGLQAFEKVTPDQIVVAIYPRVPAGSIEEFTIRTAERSHLGRGGLDTGAVLFVFMKERVARLEVGYGLEAALPDADAHRILETHLAPAFAQNAWFDGIDATLKAVFAKVQGAIKSDGVPDTTTIWKRKLTDDRPNRLARLWHSILNVSLAARVGIALLGTFVGLTMWGMAPQWARFAGNLRHGIGNLRAKRPFADGMNSVDGNALVDSVRLIFWTLGLLIPAAGVLIIAGGGSFGGAGALIHW
jgi:uncharacterized membrane protein YgcG